MAGPVITTLLAPNPATGTWAPTDNTTETELASCTAQSGTFLMRMDVSNQVDGDLIQITGYTKANLASTRRQLFQYTLGPNAPSDLIHLSPVVPVAADYRITAKLVAGSTTTRSFPWSVLNLNGA